MALAGCMAMDVVDIVIKGRHPLTALEAHHARAIAQTIRRADFSAFTCISSSPATCPRHAVERAIELSRDKYCSVWHSLRQDIDFDTTFEVHAVTRKRLSRLAARRRRHRHGRRARHRRVDATRRSQRARSTDTRCSSPASRRRCSCSSPAWRSRWPSVAQGQRRSATPRPPPLARRRGLADLRARVPLPAAGAAARLGPLVNFLKVDILNIMGLSMVAAALPVELSAHRARPHRCCSRRTVAVAMVTPLVREGRVLAALPDAIEAYIRPLRRPHQLHAVPVGRLSLRRRHRRRA